MPAEAQDDWISRVLGIDVSVAQPGPASHSADDRMRFWRESLRRWRQASDTVDESITRLQGHLRSTNDPGLKQIADQGLNGLMGGRKVALLAALHGLDEADAAAVQDAAARSLPAIEAFGKHIATDRRIAACDRNPYGVAVSIQRTFAPALANLRLAIQTIASGRT